LKLLSCVNTYLTSVVSVQADCFSSISYCYQA